LLEWDVERVLEALRGLPDHGPFEASGQGTVTFPRGRAALATALPPEVFARQRRVVEAARDAGALVHRHYEPGRWLPHVSIATRARDEDLATVVTAVSDAVPLVLRVDRVALIETSDGRRWDLPHLP
jgi:2'-5' RNA ligase